ERAHSLDVDWKEVAEANDSHSALGALGQLIEGGHTGWNLCDLYVALTQGTGTVRRTYKF
ncbi:MAG TPA: hypothetical protein VIJ86_11395, partial [Acidimicrobiales bacterium]